MSPTPTEKKTSPWFFVAAGAIMVAIMVVALVLRFRNDAGSNQRGGHVTEQPPTDDNPGAPNGPTPVIEVAGHADAGTPHIIATAAGDAGTGALPAPPFAPPQTRPADPVEPPPEGEVTVDLTRRSISAIMVEARRCVQQGRQTKPDMLGQVMMNYTLVVKGGKASVMTPFLASSDLKDPATEDCIVNSASAQTIDAKGEPDGHTRMRVPLVFGKDLPK